MPDATSAALGMIVSPPLLLKGTPVEGVGPTNQNAELLPFPDYAFRVRKRAVISLRQQESS